jgi:hypothetical protein
MKKQLLIVCLFFFTWVFLWSQARAQSPFDGPTTPATTTAPSAGEVTQATGIFGFGSSNTSAQATDALGNPVTTGAQIEGSISVNGQLPVTQATQKVTDTVVIKGNINADPTDVGQPVDVFVYVVVTFPWSGDMAYYYMLGPGGTILVWDQNPANLAAFMTFPQLGFQQEILMYSGVLPSLSTLDVFFGYRLANGTVITNSQSIYVTMTQ